MSTLVIGKVRPSHQGVWSGALTYEAFDLVSHEGGAWMAVQDVPVWTTPGTDIGYWIQFGAKGDKGETGAKGDPGVDGAHGIQGVQGIQGEPGECTLAQAKKYAIIFG